MYTLAVDIGGTFTDCVAIDETGGHVTARKVPTTQDDLLRGVFAALDHIAGDLEISTPALLGDVSRFVHATTQSSNAVFARSGARTAVLTTRGFGDTLLIMRATGRVAGLSVFERHHYRNTQKPVPLVDERDIFEISERIDHKGSVLVGLDEDEIRSIATLIGEQGYEAVAVCFLFSHKNPAHEARTGEILRDALPDCYISLSAEIAPVIGEYERSATAVFNAYVGTLIEGYLSRLETSLAERGLTQQLLMVQANGGVATAAQTVPVMTVESGPAAGVVGAALLAKQLDRPNVIATDVGGTTFKVAVIVDNNWSYARETVLNQYQLRLPMIDIASIGAGGGSIAWVDRGRLRVGPRSAAADPGPACYALGGTEPTVTDADVVLGYISPDRFLDGQMRLDPERAHAAIHDHIAEPLFGGDVLAAAAGIRRVVDSQMADLIRKTTLERGHDTRDFVMMAYGGAGPTHACSYGPESGCSAIIIPAVATVHSAFGAAITDVRFSLRYSDPLVLPVPAAKLEQFFADMEAQGGQLLRDADMPAGDTAFDRWVEARYRRQVHTVRVAAPELIDEAGIDAIAEAFHGEYERLFGVGTGLTDAGIELINYGVDAVGHVAKHDPHRLAPQRGTPQPRLRRAAYSAVQGTMVDTPVYDGAALGAGTTIDGPAIIEHPGTTVVVLGGQTAQIDEYGHTHLAGDINTKANAMPDASPPVLDPISFEVLNHRLLCISEEMGIHYMRCSGSNVLITGNDAASAIMDANGDLVAVGPYIVTQGNVLPLIVKATIDSATRHGGFEDGDIFICNDPYLGAIHAPDFATVAPIFHDGELVAWVGASGHQLDTGGMDPGGFSVKAVDIHQEGLRMPPVKLVERGQVRDDILDWIINQVRDPLVGLDVKGQIACLMTGRERIRDLIGIWGVETFKAALARSIEFAADKLRDRLDELPDGKWREVQYIDHDGHQSRIYQIVCTLTKRGRHLTFDFTGTSDNAPGLINCTYSGLQAAVLSAVYINLCWDIPWNRGVRDCIEIISAEGTVNNCAYPAPCAMATISGVIVTIDAAWRCLSQMLLASENYRDEAMAVWSGTSLAPILAGTSQHGFPFAATEMSHFGGGGGARTYADGVDTAGIVFNTTPNMPNIEDQEAEYPMLYLYRRHLRDSGGPGRFRGGRAGELAYTVYDAPNDDLVGLFAGTGAEMPNGIGIAGGMPGNAIRIGRFLGTDLLAQLANGAPLPERLEDIGGRHEIMASKHERGPIEAGDVWYHCWQAGGGYGDPLLRDGAACAVDVARGAVSHEAAHEIYGVVLTDDGAADAAATQARRQQIRQDRLAAAVPVEPDDAVVSFPGAGQLKFGDVLLVDGDGDSVSCAQCGHRHCGIRDNLLDHVREVRAPLTAAGPVRGEDYDVGRFHLRQLCCANCGTLVDVQVALDGAPRPFMWIGTP